MRRAAVVALGVVASAGLLTGCNSTHPGVSNGSLSACFRAIPVAKTAVHEKNAALIGVHRVPVDRVRAQMPAELSAELAAENDSVVCVMAFKGHFAPGQVQLAAPSAQGAYAVVLVSSRRLHLIDSFVLTTLPRSLGRRTI